MQRYDVFVIGGGGTGSEVAFQLGRAGGLKVAMAERDLLGGECNNYGCVPTKVMLRSAGIAASARDAARFGVHVSSVEVDFASVQRRARGIVDEMSADGPAPFERLGVDVLMQEARLIGPHRVELSDGTQIEADKVVLATGSQSVIPPIPGLTQGPLWTNKEAIWSSDTVPGSLAIIGAGAIGIEFAQIYGRCGSRVTVLEVAPQILPNEDEEVAASLRPAFEREGIDLRAGVRIERAEHAAGGWTLELAGGERIEADQVLVAAGRSPVFDVHDLAAAGVDIDAEGRPVLNDTLRTTQPDVWAAGDATGELLFTHVGSYEAELVADDILGRPRARDYRVIPRVTFCEPEVASVGLTERAAREAGYEVKTGVSPIADNERSVIDGRPDGMVKVVGDARSGELLGGHIVAPEAGAMIHEIVAVMAARAEPSTVAAAVHAYPTLSESVKGALLQLS